jgi:hypothetical protein
LHQGNDNHKQGNKKMAWGPQNGNFKNGEYSRVCPTPEANLTTALETRNEMLRAIENVLAGVSGGLSGSQIRQVQRVIEDRPTWAEHVIRRFKGKTK